MNKTLALVLLICLGGGVYQYVQAGRELAATKATLADAKARIEELQAQLDNPARDPRIAQEWARLHDFADSLEVGRKTMLAAYNELASWRGQLADHQQRLLEYETWLRTVVSDVVREELNRHDLRKEAEEQERRDARLRRLFSGLDKPPYALNPQRYR